MSRPSPEKTSVASSPGADEIIVSILEELGDPAALMEVFYLSREPDCLAMLRWLAMLPEEERHILAQFARAARQSDALRVETPDPNRLLLTLVRE